MHGKGVIVGYQNLTYQKLNVGLTCNYNKHDMFTSENKGYSSLTEILRWWSSKEQTVAKKETEQRNLQ